MGLGSLTDRRPAQLSVDQQQRVASARALVFEPGLVLMDEPLEALDQSLREEMQFEIKHLHEGLGITVVHVTRDQSEALAMSGRIAVFDDGIVQQCADPATLYEEPANAFVADFIGENNHLEGTITELDSHRCTVELEGDGDEKIVCRPVNVGHVGDKAALSLRPECVHVDPVDGACDNVLDGTVRDSIYLGDRIRVRATVGRYGEFVLRIPNTPDRVRLRQGDPVKIGWAAADCRAFDA